jgi:hypothetical protein
MCQRFGGACCFHLQGSQYFEYGSSELFGNVGSVSLYHSTRRHIPEDSAMFEGVRKFSKKPVPTQHSRSQEDYMKQARH